VQILSGIVLAESDGPQLRMRRLSELIKLLLHLLAQHLRISIAVLLTQHQLHRLHRIQLFLRAQCLPVAEPLFKLRRARLQPLLVAQLRAARGLRRIIRTR